MYKLLNKVYHCPQGITTGDTSSMNEPIRTQEIIGTIIDNANIMPLTLKKLLCGIALKHSTIVVGTVEGKYSYLQGYLLINDLTTLSTPMARNEFLITFFIGIVSFPSIVLTNLNTSASSTF